MKLSFKKEEREKGLAGVGHSRNVAIKIDGKEIGFIYGPSWNSKDNLWHIQIAIVKNELFEDGNPNCPWRWVEIKEKFTDENSARSYLKYNKEKLTKLHLHYFE